MKGYFLTRRATRDLENIAEFTEQNWNLVQAKKYVAQLGVHLDRIADQPDPDIQLSRRAAPFLMARAESHFVIYDIYRDWIIVAALPHGRQDIEGLVRGLEPDYVRELNEIRGRFPELDDDGTIRGA